MRWFETRGPIYPEDNYFVSRTEVVKDFADRLEKGRYIVLFAPRQTGKLPYFVMLLIRLKKKKMVIFQFSLISNLMLIFLNRFFTNIFQLIFRQQ